MTQRNFQLGEDQLAGAKLGTVFVHHQLQIPFPSAVEASSMKVTIVTVLGLPMQLPQTGIPSFSWVTEGIFSLCWGTQVLTRCAKYFQFYSAYQRWARYCVLEPLK
jgi:hypothetical protein